MSEDERAALDIAEAIYKADPEDVYLMVLSALRKVREGCAGKVRDKAMAGEFVDNTLLRLADELEGKG